MNEFLADTDFMQTFGPFIVPILGAFFATWGGIGFVLRYRRNAKKVALPHTMSEAEYVQLNEERTQR